MRIDRPSLIFLKGCFALALACCCLLHRTIESKAFEKTGHTFPIYEQSLLDLIRQSSTFSPDKYLNLLLQQAQHPVGIVSPKSAQKQRSFFIDPAFTSPEDIKTANGDYIVRKGATINPLHTLKLSSCLLFIDGSKEEHIKWAAAQDGNAKWILVKGDPFALEAKYQRPIYFDQNGYYASRFQIQSFPAKVSQEDHRLKVIEIPVGQGRGA